MVDDDQLTVSVLPTGKSHYTASASDDRGSLGSFNILSRMKFEAEASKGIPSAPKTTLKGSLNGPNRWCISSFAQD
jgi:hypothetical protein